MVHTGELVTSKASRALPRATDVLAVCAHPGDESFGLGAILAAFSEQGARVRVLCFTHGEASTLGVTHGSLAELRGEELRSAANVLGIQDVNLLSYPDGLLEKIPLEELAGLVGGVVADADLLLVFDQGGITGHPDHCRATEAALTAAAWRHVPVLAWALPDAVATQLNTEFGTGFIGRPADELDVVIEVERGRQRAAISCHASQATNNPVLGLRLELLGEREHLRWLSGLPSPSANLMAEVAITADAYAAVLHACQASFPAEVCGLIGARRGVLSQAYEVPNVADAAPGRCGFRMDSHAQLRTMRKIEEAGLDLGGIYHSHPHTPAIPSEADIRLAAYPEAVHLIVGLRDSGNTEVRVWRVAEGKSEELTLRITSEPP
jgi:N-acetylglucosamine malate deacetylase 2